MTTTPKTGDYANGWKPEPSLKKDAKALVNIIFDPETSPSDAAGAASTLVGIVDPQVMLDATTRGKLSRNHRLLLASYIANHSGLSDTEADLAEIIKDPMPDLVMHRFRGTAAEKKRVTVAIELLNQHNASIWSNT